jgi:hypothetical protein
MGAGGKREGAGRPAGSKGPYKPRKLKPYTAKQEKKILSKVSQAPEDLPLHFFLATMQDVFYDRDGNHQPMDFKQRFEAAVHAAPYVHAKKASVEVRGDETAPLQVQSDIGQALKQLAEMARTRSLADTGNNVIDLEPATLPDQTDGSR